MHPKLTLATTARVLRQLAHDRRTIALVFVMPVLLLGLLAWMFSSNLQVFDYIGPPLLGIFPFIMMFLITAITTLRERSSGTLERLMTTRIGKLDILLGYAFSFGLLAIIQATIASLAALNLFGLDIAGPEWMLIVVALANALLGTALGLLASAFARTEFQATQFMPAFILPQILLCGLLVPVEKLPDALQLLANILPLTYAVDALMLVAKEAVISAQLYVDLLVIFCFTTVAIVLAAVTLRRQTK
jgi:ABC-2 type transport system permease protein